VRPERIPTSDSNLLSVSITPDTLLPVGALGGGSDGQCGGNVIQRQMQRFRSGGLQAGPAPCQRPSLELHDRIQPKIHLILKQSSPEFHPCVAALHTVPGGGVSSMDDHGRLPRRAFWVEVFNYCDSSGEQAFRDLAQFALSLLAMPLSNADMALVKTRLRNRMGQETLSSILHVRYGLRWQGKCCRDFEPTADMLLRLNSRMYVEEEKQTAADGSGDADGCF
ncbi:Uncharacterized protein FKW44_019828, partial [Caligus rogercresseyi]